jgi:hypothetical protein
MRVRLLGAAALLALVSTAAEAATLQFDFGSNSPGGFFVANTATDTIVDWYISSGNLLGGGDYTHYAGGPSQNSYPVGTAALDCQTFCVASFTTQGSGASSGLVTLTLSFAEVFLDSSWDGPWPQSASILELHSRGVPAVGDIAATGVWQGVGVIYRTVLVADPPIPETPLPAALPLFATGLGALGLLGWRRKRKGAALAA